MSSFTKSIRRFTQPAVILTNVAAGVNIVGGDNPCSRALLRSHPDNAGVIWVNCKEAAAEGSCWPLSIGDGIEFSLKNTNEINALLMSGGDKLTVIYEV